MNQQQQKAIKEKKKIEISYANNGYVVVFYADDPYMSDNQLVFKNIDEVIKYIKQHYKQLEEDIRIAKLTE